MMLEQYASFVLSRMRGSTNTSGPQDARNQPHKRMLRGALSALFASPIFLAGLFSFHLDFSRILRRAARFLFGQLKVCYFSSHSHHCHEMIVRVEKDDELY